jgi:DNA-binding transcriptional regulator YhcF (GntR family)
MSIKTMSQVWEQPRVKGTDKLALLALADYANDDGYCFPSYGSFAKKVGVERRQAMRVIEKLERMGEVYVIERPGHRNYYVVLTGQDEAGIAHRLTQCGEVPKEKVAEAVAEVIKRRGVIHDTPKKKRQRGVIHDTGRGVIHDTGGVSSMTPKPSKNRQHQPSKQTTTPANGTRAPSEHQSIIDSFLKELGYRPQNMGREVKAVKWLAEHQFTPDQVLACYRHLKRDKFWRDKFVSLQKVADEITEFSRNGHAPAQTYRKPTQAEIDAAKAAPIVEV